MKTKSLVVYIPTTLIILILALIPFHAFLTVWVSSLIGHYTLLRLWKEFLLAICVVAAIYLFLTDKAVRDLFYYSRLVQLILLFLVIELIWGIVAKERSLVNSKALFYGWLSDCRYLIFFIVTLIFAKKSSLLKNKAIKLILWPAVIVVAFGLLQIFVLPRGFLSHFGYGPNTIQPYQTINSNSNYVRILSTLRGSDPLGAYLLIPISLAAVILVRGRRVWQIAVFLVASLIVMLFSFSRSAWLGLVVALALAIYLGAKSKSLKRHILYLFAAIVILVAGLLVIERNNTHIQNILFHTQNNSAIKTTSDENHSSALRAGVKQVLTEPLGKGPGTAGPASVYNNQLARIPENYYVQIGQELGWLGLIVYVAISLLIFLSLLVRTKDTLSLALLVSFIGLFICNMLLESWTDDTLSYLWWGLAGITLAIRPLKVPLKKTPWIL